jgi:thiamine pyrophosphokinase
MNPINKILGYDASKDKKYPVHIKTQKQMYDFDSLSEEQQEEYNNLKRHGHTHSVAYKIVKGQKYYSKY